MLRQTGLCRRQGNLTPAFGLITQIVECMMTVAEPKDSTARALPDIDRQAHPDLSR
jgi:hypothetical protein